MITVEALITEARAHLGVRYRHQGRTAGGLDCIGFVIFVLQRKGLLPEEFERNNYGRLPRAELVEKTALYCERVPQPEAGALLLLRWPGEREAGHSALFTGENLIHSYSTVGKVVEHGFRAPWPKLVVSCWRLPGVKYG